MGVACRAGKGAKKKRKPVRGFLLTYYENFKDVFQVGLAQSGRSVRKAMPVLMVPSRLMRLRAASLSADEGVW